MVDHGTEDTSNPLDVRTIAALPMHTHGRVIGTTMHQETLFSQQRVTEEPDICRNRHRRSDTSMLADQRVNKSRDRELVYSYIKAAGSYGMTLDEISICLDRAPNRLSGRCSELKKSGRIIATTATRKTRTGSWAHVYVVTA